MHVSHVVAQVIQDGKSILLTQLLGLYSRNGHRFLPYCVQTVFSFHHC